MLESLEIFCLLEKSSSEIINSMEQKLRSFN